MKSSDVVAEYKRAFGDNHFGGGNKDILITLRSYDSPSLRSLVKDAAESWYTPTNNTITTHRGQGMTQAGIDKLYTDFENKKTYGTGQFFSTSKNPEIAAKFAENSLDDAKVIFEIKGNSSNGLFVKGGLSFGAAQNRKEAEKLYSPR